MRTSSTTMASILIFIDSFVWLVGLVPTLGYAFRHRALPTMGGIRLLGGPFESLSIDALMVAGLVFVVVSALKIMAGYWLWNARLGALSFRPWYREQHG